MQRKPRRGWERDSSGRYYASDVQDALTGPIPDLPKGGDVRNALAAHRPRLLQTLSSEEIMLWQQAVNRAAAEREVRRMADALLRKLPPGSEGRGMYEGYGLYHAWRRRAEAALPPGGPTGGMLRVDASRFLDPNIMKVEYDVNAETEFRQWAIARLTSSPIDITLIDPDVSDMRYAQQMLSSDDAITVNALRSIFPDEYRTMVSDRPAMQELRKLVVELSQVYHEINPDFQDRLRLNEKYSGGLAFVRYWSEWLGEGDTDMPDAAEWNGAYAYVFKPASDLLRAGKVELAVPMLIQAEILMADVANRFLKYEHRVTSGAGVAVKWLERVKTAGSVAASLAAGPLGMARAALVTGAYIGGQDIAQQASEVALGQRKEIDFKSAAKSGFIASAMAMIGGPLKIRFEQRITAALASTGSATVVQKTVSDALAGMAQSFYTTPLELVMQRVITGKKLPGSLEELCDMVVTQALEGAAMDIVTKPMGDRISKITAERAATKAPAGGIEVRSSRLGEELLSMAGPDQKITSEAHTAKGGTSASGTTTPASHGNANNNGVVDPAFTPDPTFETGLTSKASMGRVAHEAHKLYDTRKDAPVNPASAAPQAIEETAKRIMKFVTPELPTGMPAPVIDVQRMNSATKFGHYDPSTNTIVVNADARINGDRTGAPAFGTDQASFQRLLGLVYHEARHAEQTFHALRVRAANFKQHDEGTRGWLVQTETNVHRGLADAAAKRPLDAADTSAEAKLGREVWAESYQQGPRRELRNWSQGVMGESQVWRTEIANIRQAVALAEALGPLAPEMHRAWQWAQDAEAGLGRAAETYRNLAEEIDARRAAFNIEVQFQQILAAQLDLNMARTKLDQAQDILGRVPAGVDSEKKQALQAVVARTRELQIALQERASLLPRGKAPTGSSAIAVQVTAPAPKGTGRTPSGSTTTPSTTVTFDEQALLGSARAPDPSDPTGQLTLAGRDYGRMAARSGSKLPRIVTGVTGQSPTPTGPTTPHDFSNPIRGVHLTGPRMSSAQDRGSGPGPEDGVRPAHLPGAGPAVVKSYLDQPGYRAKIQEEMAVGKIAENAGVGVRIHGVVEMPSVNPEGDPIKAVGFAMGEAEGGFFDLGRAENLAAARELAANARNINAQSYRDVMTFRDALTRAGRLAELDIQGFVGPDGRWRPIDFQSYRTVAEANQERALSGDSPLTAAEVAKANNEVFKDYMKEMREARDAAASGNFNGFNVGTAPTGPSGRSAQSAAGLNTAAEQTIRAVLADRRDVKTRNDPRHGVVFDVYSSTGIGIRFTMAGQFIRFLER